MSVRKKLREVTMQAQEARRKAGPMFRQAADVSSELPGRPLQPDEMPDIYRRWTAIAEGHEAEAKRLRAILNTPMSAAAE